MFEWCTQLGLMVPSIMYITPFFPFDNVSLLTKMQAYSYLFHPNDVYIIFKGYP